jgi:hypothetical protein
VGYKIPKNKNLEHLQKKKARKKKRLNRESESYYTNINRCVSLQRRSRNTARGLMMKTKLQSVLFTTHY